jgi:hypothetical protein
MQFFIWGSWLISTGGYLFSIGFKGIEIGSVYSTLGIASLFRAACKNQRCIEFHAPPLEELKDKVYKFDNKCYKYTTKQTKCDKNKKTVDFA